MADQLHQAKVDKLYDLMRRACVNGRTKEVAEAVAADWSPVIEINESGFATFPELDNVQVRCS